MSSSLFDGLDACVVSDAMDSLGIASQVADGIRSLWEGGRVAGRIVTVQLTEGTPPPGHPVVHLGVTAIERCAAGEVIVVDNGGRTAMGSWGGLLSRAAQLAGVAGIVTDGAVRDVDEARSLRFPVFGRGGAVRTARGRIYELATGAPVTVGGFEVSTGDWVVADGSGVVFVPADRVDEVAATARGLVDREAVLLGRAEGGESLASVFGISYESMLEGGRR
ncbi:RraA family protein [Rhodococcus sp. NPDC057529]|uniref:RraA family protein n=1 Tax=Rhodococcus sp. NPDC057529 TaxID=3346158 RepID=UPI00366DF817